MKPSVTSVLFLLVALAGVAIAANSSWGKPNSTNILLLREIVVRSPLKNGYQSVTVDYPKSVSAKRTKLQS